MNNLKQVIEKLSIASDIREKFAIAATHDYLRHAVDVSYGGLGDSYQDFSKCYIELGQHSLDMGLILTLHAHLWGIVYPLLKFGSEKQKQDFFPQILQGNLIGGHGITEPNVGSDTSKMKSTYTVENNHVILKVHKCWVTNTPVADWLVIYARSDENISAFLVARDDEGVTFSQDPCVHGFHGSTMGDVIIENAKLGLDRVIGKLGAGARMIQATLELERIFLFSGIVGVMRWQLKEITYYLRNRKIDGNSLYNKQALNHKVAEMATNLEICELLLEKAAKVKDTAKRVTMISSQSKLFISECFLESSLNFIHLMGTLGLNKEDNYVRFVHDAQASKILSGTSEVQKNIIANLVL